MRSRRTTDDAITPIALAEGWTDADPAVAKRVFDAMKPMKKVDIASIEAARLSVARTEY